MRGDRTIGSPDICEAAWAFYEGQRQAGLDVFQGWGQGTDWGLIKILIPTLPIFLPSQQPAFLFVVLGILL